MILNVFVVFELHLLGNNNHKIVDNIYLGLAMYPK